jgi:hypothetical protein
VKVKLDIPFWVKDSFKHLMPNPSKENIEKYVTEIFWKGLAAEYDACQLHSFRKKAEDHLETL